MSQTIEEMKEKFMEEMLGMLEHGLNFVNIEKEIKVQEQLIQNLTVTMRSQSPQQASSGGVALTILRDENYMRRAEHIKKLFDLRDELHWTAEKLRMDNLVSRHRQQNPLNTEVCPICLQDVPITCVNSVQYFVCCGNFMCYQCLQSSVAGGEVRMKNCPCCREDLFIGPEQTVRQIEEQAKRGRPWAQANLGIYFLEGSSCEHGDVVTHKVDVKEAMKWLKLAAEQKQPDAIRIIAQLHAGVYDDAKEVVEQCQVKGRALMKEAADLGNLRAQRNYAMMCRMGQGGPTDEVEAAHYYTLVYFQKSELSLQYDYGHLPEEILHACLYLGMYHYYGKGGFTKHLHKAKHYLEEHVKELEKQCLDVGPDAYTCLAACLMELQEYKYGQSVSNFSIPGYSSVPRAMSLYRKAIKLGIDRPNEYSRHSKEVLDQLVTKQRWLCANCGAASKDSPQEVSKVCCLKAEGKLKECGRCHSAWYCGKACQTEHWKAGHKMDCVKQQV